jgi:hypothetical protein
MTGLMHMRRLFFYSIICKRGCADWKTRGTEREREKENKMKLWQDLLGSAGTLQLVLLIPTRQLFCYELCVRLGIDISTFRRAEL